MFESRKYAIINAEEIDKVNFLEVEQTSKETCLFSLDKTKVLLKWESEKTTESVQKLNLVEGPYTYAEINDILKNSFWSEPIEDLIQNI